MSECVVAGVPLSVTFSFSLPLLLRLTFGPGLFGLWISPEKWGEEMTNFLTIAVAGRMTFG